MDRRRFLRAGRVRGDGEQTTGLFRSDDAARNFMRIDDARHRFGGVFVAKPRA